MLGKNTLRATAAVAALVASMTGWQARAADDPAGQKKHGSTQDQEIVVTATKRPVDVQKVPEAITAITDQQLDDLNAQSFADYFRTVPGLTLNTLRPGVLDFSLRGISDFSDLVPATAPQRNPTVGQYIDEIPITAVGQQIDSRLVDIDHIEVLRGPQGTFFGEDSLGGTIRLITKKPNLTSFSGAIEGRVSATAHGGVNDSESMMLNVPLIRDHLGIRANYFRAQDSGFIDAVCPPPQPFGPPQSCVAGSVTKDINPSRANGGRVMVLFKPTDRISLLGEFVHTYSVARESAFYDLTLGDLTTPKNPDSTAFVDRSNLYNLTGNVDLGWASLVSSSSWGERTSDQQQPQGGVAGGTIFSSNNFAQEVRLVSSKDWSERWDYVVGLYYSHLNGSTENYPAGGQGSGYNTMSKTVAAFGEVGYKFTNHLNIRLGLRQQTINYSTVYGPDTYSGRNTPTTGRAVVNYVFNDDAMMYGSYSKGFRKGGVNTTINAFTPGVPIPGVPQSFNPDTTTNYELGWKFRFPSQHATFDVAVYHIDWQNIQTVALTTVPGAPPPGVTQYYANGPAAKVDGIEVEGSLEVFKGLRAQASFSWQNPVMTKNASLLSDNPTAVPPFFAPSFCQHGCPAREGDQIPFTARTSGSFTLSYRRPVGGTGLTGFAVASEQYTGARHTDFNPIWTGPSQAPTLQCPIRVFGPCPVPLVARPRTVTGDPNPFYSTMKASVLTNLQLGVENEQWRASIFVDNVFDVRNQDIRTQDSVSVGRPRTIGVFLRRRF